MSQTHKRSAVMPTDAQPRYPRSGNEKVGGYVWLGRLLDKARMHAAGRPDGYESLGGIDAMFLGRLGIEGPDIRRWLAQGLDDEAVAARITARNGFTPAQVQAWSKRFQRLIGVAILALDAEEGRMKPGPVATIFGGASRFVNKVEHAIARLTGD